MSVRKQDGLRAFLESERARLGAVIAQSETEGGENLGYGNHMADDASEAFEQAKELALHQHARRLLGQVEGALVRLDQGGFGFCTHCGDEIDPARLEALPYAELCLRCQQRQNP